jgi:hypothetical protein
MGRKAYKSKVLGYERALVFVIEVANAIPLTRG